MRNRDGTLARHVEFENSLCPTTNGGAAHGGTDGGDSILALLLAGEGATVGGWDISLGNPGVPAGFDITGGTATLPPACGPQGVVPSAVFVLVPSGTTVAGCSTAGGTTGFFGSALCFTGLNPPVPASSSAGSFGVTLAGQFTVPATSPGATISAVGTAPSLCNATTCGVPTLQFTGAYLTGTGSPAPITVVASQSVSVTVQISFQ